MIGPHEGKELEMMLSGEKHLAIFHDALVIDKTIPEEVIPEKAFSTHVKKGTFTRVSKITTSPKTHLPVLYVLFTTKGQEWRAEAFFWIQKECLENRRPFDDAYEYFVGRLLDYQERDIEDFIQHKSSFKRTPLA